MIYIIKGLKNTSDKAPLYFYNGKIMERTGLKDAAMLLYESAAKEDSAYLPVYAFLGTYYYEHGQKSRAEGYLSNYFRYSKANLKVNMMLGELAENSGQGKKAIEYFEEALVRDTTDKTLKLKLDNLYNQYAPKEKESVKTIPLQDIEIAPEKRETKTQPKEEVKTQPEVKKDTVDIAKPLKAKEQKTAKEKVLKDTVKKPGPEIVPEVEQAIEPKPEKVETPPVQIEKPVDPEVEETTKRKKKNKKESKGEQ